jgi:hypothetical protein
MKVISHAIQMYFCTRSTSLALDTDTARDTMQSINFVAPRSKFGVCDVVEPKIKSRRVRNKRVAILMAEKLLTENGDSMSLKFLQSKTKKDDLADSFVQGVYFLRYLNVCNQQKNRIKRHIEPLNPSGIVIDLNEDCEEDEIPLPLVYKSNTFVGQVYSSKTPLEPSSCYSSVPMSSVHGKPQKQK